MKVKDYFISESHNLFCILLIKITVNVNIHLCFLLVFFFLSSRKLGVFISWTTCIILSFGFAIHYIILGYSLQELKRFVEVWVFLDKLIHPIFLILIRKTNKPHHQQVTFFLSLCSNLISTCNVEYNKLLMFPVWSGSIDSST